MNNILDYKYIRFSFEMRDGSVLKLKYKLHPTSLREKYLNQIKERNSEDNTYLDLKISNKTSLDLEYLIEKINTIIEQINKYYDKQLPMFTDTKNLNHEILNHLHEQFEVYGERHHQIIEVEKRHLNFPEDPNVWPGHRFNQVFHEQWMKLNEYIHIIEMAMDNTPNHFPWFSCLVHVYPPVLGEPIQEIDKLFLDSNFHWGQLYLGYNTLGKDFMHTAHDDDVRVIINDQVKVQEYFSTESYLMFTEGHVPNELISKFYAWYENQPQEVKDKIPTNNLNKLAFGRYHIGSIEIDETFLSYESDYRKWMHDHELKKRWNLEVFSKIEKALSIEIVQ